MREDCERSRRPKTRTDVPPRTPYALELVPLPTPDQMISVVEKIAARYRVPDLLIMAIRKAEGEWIIAVRYTSEGGHTSCSTAPRSRTDSNCIRITSPIAESQRRCARGRSKPLLDHTRRVEDEERMTIIAHCVDVLQRPFGSRYKQIL